MDALDEEQIDGLRKAFDSFDTEKVGCISIETISTILRMMGLKVTEKGLKEVVDEVDEDGSGELEFEEFCQLAAKFLIEEDEESLKEELRKLSVSTIREVTVTSPLIPSRRFSENWTTG